MSDYMTEDHRVKKKKKKTDVSFSENVSFSEHTELERKKKKKKNKHRSTDDETITEVTSLENLSPSYSQSSFVKLVEQEHTLEQESSTLDCNSNTWMSQKKKKKKKKRREESVEEALEETDRATQASLYDDQNHSDGALLSESVRKKKKKHRPPESIKLEEDGLENIQQTSPLITFNENIDVERPLKKKKKRHRPPEIINLKEDGLEDLQQTSPLLTLNENIDVERPLKKKKKRHRPPEIINLEEDGLEDLQQISPLLTLNENIDVERPSKKKKTVSAQETSLEVVTGANRTVKTGGEHKIVSYLSPKARSSQKVTLAEDASFNENADLENLEASEEEALEGFTEPADCATDDDVEASAKTKKSVTCEKKGNQDQDVTAKLDHTDEDQMETTLDEETSDPKKKNSDRPKRSRLSVSASEVLRSLREKDLALFEEYFPRIRSLSAKTIKDLISYELGRIKEAKKHGIMYETGRFDHTEDEQIKKNVEDFRKLVGLESGEMLFYSNRFPSKMITIEKLKRKYHFRQRIAKGIARTVTEIHNRGAKLYDLSSNKGRYTKEEIETLRKGLSEYGNNWVTIGHLVGRNCKNVQLKASQLRRQINGGKWSIEEVNRLIQAVKEFILSSLKSKKNKNVSNEESLSVPKEMLFSGIPWAKIEKKVETRNWAHCKSKWNDVLLLRMNDGVSPFEGVWGLHTNIDIIKWLHGAKLPRGRVDWLKMAKNVGNIPPGILQQKVYKLKCRFVPNWQSLSFQEIVDHLYTEAIPKLEANIHVTLISQETPDIPEKKDEFLIGEIFREYSGDDKCLKSFFLEDSNDFSS